MIENWYKGRADKINFIKVTLPARLSHCIPEFYFFFHFVNDEIPYFLFQVFFENRESQILEMIPIFIKWGIKYLRNTLKYSNHRYTIYGYSKHNPRLPKIRLRFF